MNPGPWTPAPRSPPRRPSKLPPAEMSLRSDSATQDDSDLTSNKAGNHMDATYTEEAYGSSEPRTCGIITYNDSEFKDSAKKSATSDAFNTQAEQHILAPFNPVANDVLPCEQAPMAPRLPRDLGLRVRLRLRQGRRPPARRQEPRADRLLQDEAPPARLAPTGSPPRGATRGTPGG